MPRSFGKVLPSMWDEDEDFLAMSANAKYVYNFLLGQRDLGHSGVITLRVGPWARLLSKSVAETKAALRELHVERFVVIDADEMLLLVRALIRRDEVYKQPNTFKSAVNQIYGVRSQPIRRVLLAELERLEPAGMKGDSEAVRSDVIAWLRKTCENPPPNPSRKGSAKGYESDPGGDAEFGQDFDVPAGEESSAKGSAIPNGNPQRVHARSRARVSPAPTTTTTPTTLAPLASVTVLPLAARPDAAAAPQGDDGALFDAPPSTAKPRGKNVGKKPKKVRTPEEQARFDLANSLTRAWYDALKIKPSGDERKVFLAARAILEGLLAVDNQPDAIAEAARRCDRMITRNAMEYQLVAMEREASRVVLPFQRRGAYVESEDRAYGPLASAFESPGA